MTGIMSTLDETGDTKILWNSDNVDEVAAAKASFELLTKKGYAAFRAEGKEGKQGGKLTSFDPTAERIILVPPMAGG